MLILLYKLQLEECIFHQQEMLTGLKQTMLITNSFKQSCAIFENVRLANSSTTTEKS